MRFWRRARRGYDQHRNHMLAVLPQYCRWRCVVFVVFVSCTRILTIRAFPSPFKTISHYIIIAHFSVMLIFFCRLAICWVRSQALVLGVSSCFLIFRITSIRIQWTPNLNGKKNEIGFICHSFIQNESRFGKWYFFLLYLHSTVFGACLFPLSACSRYLCDDADETKPFKLGHINVTCFFVCVSFTFDSIFFAFFLLSVCARPVSQLNFEKKWIRELLLSSIRIQVN